MKQKPWTLTVLAALHILAPFGNLVANAIQFGRTIPGQWYFWMNLTPLPMLVIYMVVPVIAGVCIYICRKWSYWVYLGCLGIILLSNLFSLWTHMTWSVLGFLVLVLLVDLLVVAYFVVPSVQKIYLDPRLRWWEAAPRFHLDEYGTANAEKCFIKNLSQGGLLIADAPQLSESQSVVTAFEFENQNIEVPGVVVYVGQIQGKKSHGIRFEHTTETREKIKRVIQKLEHQGKIVKERLPGPEDGFGVWLKRLFTTGQGLFPASR